MRTFLTLLLTAASLGLMAQSGNLVFFTENGEKFVAYTNGKQVNSTPESNVTATDIRTEFLKLRVVFENPSLGEFSANIGCKPGAETTYNIRQNKKGAWVATWQGEGPMQATMVVREAAPVDQGGNGSIMITSSPAPASTVVRETTTVTTTTPGGNVNMNVGVPGNGIGMNVEIRDGVTGEQISTNVNLGINMGVGVNTSQSTTMTTTTTTTTTGMVEPARPAQTQAVQTSSNCTMAMSGNSFSTAVNSIQSKSFEESKITTAKQVVSANCLSTSQVVQLLGLFSFEESKLEMAKFAYARVVDPANYFQVNDAFTFESSIDDLNAYIQQNRR